MKIWVNDLYEPLANFWQTLQHEGNEIASRLRTFKTAYILQKRQKNFFWKVRNWLTIPLPVSPLVLLVFILLISVLSLVSPNRVPSQTSSQSNFSIRGIDKLPEYSKLIQHWKITNQSYEDLLTDNKNVFTYFDPPYEIGVPIYGKRGEMHKYFDHDKFAADCDGQTNHQMIS